MVGNIKILIFLAIMMNINKVLNNRRLTLALTGLTPQEFVDLLPTFEQVWKDKRQQDYKRNRKNRTRKPGGGRKGFLREMRDKLFFYSVLLQMLSNL